MTNLERIESSVELQMALSELLFEKLWPGCWRRIRPKNYQGIKEYVCKKCGLLHDAYEKYSDHNPNLFTRESFLDVFDAVKKTPLILCTGSLRSTEKLQVSLHPEGDWKFAGFDFYYIASPRFQYLLLKWLLEQDNEGERLTSILEGEGA